MKLQFWGAAQTVTGSMHLLMVNGQRILLDCGLYQGHRKEAFERNKNFPFDPAQIDTLILSHAHIDHTGNVPTLVKQGYRGPIWATNATRDLCATMLLDSAYIQENDVKYVNKRRVKQGKTPFEPLYTKQHTLGRKILEGQSVVPIFGDEYSVKAKVVKINGYSAHADHNGLLNWLKTAQERSNLKKLFLVHGELEAATAIAEAAREQGVPDVYIPARGENFTL